MYLIELIIKKIMQRKQKKHHQNLVDEEISYEACEHVFMPIDSTNEVLSCSKCGFIVKRHELKNNNFFET